MRRFTTTLAALALAAVLAACGSDDTGGAGATSPTASPTATTFDGPSWRVTVPAGWKQEDWTSKADAKAAIRYTDDDGSYVIVAADPLGSDFVYDALWRYTVKDGKFEIVEKYSCEGKADDQACRTDDARFDAYVLAQQSGSAPPSVGGHTYYFIFGNDKTKTVTDLDVFERIIESVESK